MSDTDTKTLDRKILGQLQEMDRQTGRGTLEKIVRLFLKSFPERIESLKRAHSAGETGEIRKLVHTMKSSAGNLGAMTLSAYCRQVEEVADENMAAQAPALFAKLQSEFDVVKDLLLRAGMLKTP